MLTGLDPAQTRLLIASLDRAATAADVLQGRAHVAGGHRLLGPIAETATWCRDAASDLARREHVIARAMVFAPGWAPLVGSSGGGAGPVVTTASAITGGVSAATAYGERLRSLRSGAGAPPGSGRRPPGPLGRLAGAADGPAGTATTVFLEGRNLVSGSPYGGARGEADEFVSSLVVAAAGVSLFAGPQVLGAYLAVNGAWDAGNWLYDRRQAIVDGARGAARAAVRGAVQGAKATGRMVRGAGERAARNLASGHRRLRETGAAALDGLGDAASATTQVLADGARGLFSHRW